VNQSVGTAKHVTLPESGRGVEQNQKKSKKEFRLARNDTGEQ